MSTDTHTSVQSNFDFTKTLVTALIGAIIAQLIILFIGWAKNAYILKQKRKLIVDDLTNQLTVLSRLEDTLTELDKKFEKRDTLTYTSDAFHDLHNDIYESIPKNDLHKIFKSNVFKLVNIYKSIDFLNEYSVANIYNTYLQKTQIHIKEKESESNHDYFCQHHIHFIEMARAQIKNNLDTISSIQKETMEIINLYD